jgi:hypothetical protein
MVRQKKGLDDMALDTTSNRWQDKILIFFSKLNNPTLESQRAIIVSSMTVRSFSSSGTVPKIIYLRVIKVKVCYF